MSRLLLSALLIVSGGCSRPAGPVDSDPTPEPGGGAGGGVRGTGSIGDASGSGARVLKVSDRYRIGTAFDDNPQRAVKEYANVRWRLRVRVDEIGPSRLIAAVIWNGDVGAATIRMRSDREVEKLNRGKSAIIEARVVEFNPGKWDGVHFDDGVCVSVGDAAVSPEPIEGKRNLDKRSLDEMIEAFDNGTGRDRYKALWKFSGKVARRTNSFGSAYPIDVPDVGRVKVNYPGGDRQPVTGETVSFEAAVAVSLEFEGDKPILCFRPR